MKAKEIDINEFKTINDVYNFIDENAFELDQSYELTNIWLKYKEKTLNEVEKQKSQWEFDCFFFDIKGKCLFSKVYSSKENNKELGRYPDLNKIQSDVIDYIILRTRESNNPLLKARYNHLLWEMPSKVKNNQYAYAAIEFYISSINQCCSQYIKDRHKQIDNDTDFQIGNLYEILIAISSEIRSDAKELKILTKHLLFEIPEFEFYLKHDILNDMLKYPKLFKPIDFDGTLDLIENEINKNNDNANDYNLVEYLIPTAIKIATKTQSDVKKWHTKKGIAFLKLAEAETEEDRFWIKQDFHTSAIIAFSNAGNIEKRKEAEELYAKLKPKIKLPSKRFNYKIEDRKCLIDSRDALKRHTKSVLNQTPNEIYRTISNGNFFPSHSDINRVCRDFDNSFLDLVTTIHFDKNKNITKSYDKEDENNNNIYDIYGEHLNMITLPYLFYIIVPGIASGKLTFKNFISYIKNNTWIGRPHIKYDLGGKGKAINWIGLLSPSIVDFFIQVQGFVNSKYYKPNFILCIDSLTLKIEGLLRDFCERVKIPTSVNRKKGMQEAYIHNVLENDKFKEYFNDDDLLFLKYLFTNENGKNLRNNVAHCFSDYEEYHLNTMLLLLAALLRLGKYNYKK